MIQKNNYYVLTGGPGVGKTSLLNELQNRGYACIPEVARNIIREQVSTGGNALPWGSLRNYSDLMLEKSVQDYVKYQKETDILFFDRGIPDTYGYEKLIDLSLSLALKEAVKKYRYNKKVFILPFWEEIYQTDTERKQDLKEAKKTFEMMKSVYNELGYQCIEVPKISVEERADFVIGEVGK